MNTARANQVLDDISQSIDHIEASSERLCILIAEARREGYWQLRYKTESQWLYATFKTSYSWFYRLAKAGEVFYDNPSVINEIGVNKANIIAPFAKSEDLGKWVDIARRTEKSKLKGYVRQSFISNGEEAQKRINNLLEQIALLDKKKTELSSEISSLKKKWGIAEAA